MHPFKKQASDSRDVGRKRYKADGGSVDDILGSGAGLLKMAVEPFGLIKGIGKAFRGDDEDKNAPNFVPKKSGGKVKKKGC